MSFAGRGIVALLLLLALGGIVGLVLGEDPASEAGSDVVTVHDLSLLVCLVRSDAGQQALQLTHDQRHDIARLVDEVEYPLFLLRDQSLEAQREHAAAIKKQIDDSLHATLTVPQRERIAELLLRAKGWPAVVSPANAVALKLSSQQVAEMRRILAEAAADKSFTGPALDKRISKLMTSEQLSRLTQLIGEPFDLSRVPQVACRAPELRDVSEWVNAQPHTLQSLRGQVVVLHFFAFGCINCVNNQAHYKAWHERYANKGVTVLGVHTPETERERDTAQLRANVKAREIAYPIAVDSQASNWRAWSNNMWPSVYLIDKRGYVRYWWYGELNWQGAKGEELMRQRIDDLLAEDDGARAAPR